MIDPQVEEFVHTAEDGTQYYIPAAVEYGHAFPGRGGGKKPSKDVPATPFMRPAFDSEASKAEQVVKTKLIQGIEQVAKG